MEMIDKVTRTAKKMYTGVCNKTESFSKETKLKFKIRTYKDDIEDIYQEIGKRVYEIYMITDSNEIDSKLLSECLKVSNLSLKISDLEKEILELKNKTKCFNCGTKIEKCDKYCFNCGEKQQEETKKNESENDKDSKQAKKEDLQKTIMVESNVKDIDVDDYNIYQEELDNLAQTVEIESNNLLDNDKYNI